MKPIDRVIALVVLALAWPVTVQAEPSAEELAARFIDLSRLDEQRVQMIDIMLANLREASKHDPALQNSELSEADRDAMFGVMQEEVQTIAEELATPLRANMIAFYVDEFSEDELRELIAIYESPVFAKQFDLLPQIMQRNAEIVQVKMGEVRERIVQRLQDWLEEKNR